MNLSIHKKIQKTINNTITNSRFKIIKNLLDKINIINKKKRKKIWLLILITKIMIILKTLMDNKMKKSRRMKGYRMKKKIQIYKIRIITFTKSIADCIMQILYLRIDCNNYWMRNRI